jgi:uncharacterized protein YrrD
VLWNASAIKGYAIEATDGHVGHVNDFLFSDVDWSIQSVVVGAGGWLHAHTVRLPSAVVGVPDVLRRDVAVRLTRAEVEAYAKPGTEADPLLRGLDDAIGYAVHAADGDIGYVTDLLVDDESWGIRYLVIDTGHWFSGDKVLLVPSIVRGLDTEQRLVNVDVTRQQIEASPPYDPSATMDRGYETALHGYYGWSAYF